MILFFQPFKPASTPWNPFSLTMARLQIQALSTAVMFAEHPFSALFLKRFSLQINQTFDALADKIRHLEDLPLPISTIQVCRCFVSESCFIFSFLQQFGPADCLIFTIFSHRELHRRSATLKCSHRGRLKASAVQRTVMKTGRPLLIRSSFLRQGLVFPP